eukprot:3653694-Amphidinium_carterae.1
MCRPVNCRSPTSCMLRPAKPTLRIDKHLRQQGQDFSTSKSLGVRLRVNEHELPECASLHKHLPRDTDKASIAAVLDAQQQVKRRTEQQQTTWRDGSLKQGHICLECHAYCASDCGRMKNANCL